MRQIMSLLLALCLIVGMVPLAASAEENSLSVTEQTTVDGNIQYVKSVPIPDGAATNSIFLNGNDATISAEITENSYTLQILVNGTTYTYELTNTEGTPTNVPSIFGGKYIGESPSADVTVNGDQTITVDSTVLLYLDRYYPISRLLAGGAGAATSYGSRASGTTYYKATTNGTVTLNVAGYVSAVRGGGSGDSTVNSSIINVSGQAYTIYGGGDAPLGSVANLTGGTTSTCHVNNAQINITETGRATYVYGGGYSIASVGTASIVVAGNASTVTASGTNGYTGSSTIQIESTATITPAEGYPAIAYGWNGYGVGATVTNEGTINGDVVLGTLNETNSVSGTNAVLSFTNNGTMTGTAMFGNVGEQNIDLSGDVTLSAKNFSDTGSFVLGENQTITLSDGATWTGKIQTMQGTVLSATSESGTTTLSANSSQKNVVASVNGTSYSSLAEAVTHAQENDTIFLLGEAELTSAIDKNITIQGNGQTLTVKENGAINANVILNNVALTVANEGATSFLNSTGTLRVQSGTSLTMLDAEMIGNNGNLKLGENGAITLRMGENKLNVTINGEAEVPSGKQWTTRMTTGVSEDTAILMDVTISEDAKLTVSSTGSDSTSEPNKYGFRVANDTTLTVNGTLNAADGVFDQSNSGNVIIGENGSVSINGIKDLYQGKITGTTTVNAGGQLTVGEIRMVGATGNLNVTSGTLTLDMEEITSASDPSIDVTLNGQAEIPTGKRWTTMMGTEPKRVAMAVTIANGSTLTVNGGTTDSSGLHVANDTTLTNNGTINVNTEMTVGSSGKVAGNGAITVGSSGALEIDTNSSNTGTLQNSVSNSGTVIYNGTQNSNNITGTITLVSGGKVYSQADLSNHLSGEEVLSNKNYEGTNYSFAWQYDVPSGGDTPSIPSNPGDNKPEEPEEPTFPFEDVAEDAWYRAAVEYVYENSLMAGTSATTFDPEMNLTRAMTAQILYNLEGKPEVAEGATFADMGTAPSWSLDAIAWAQDTGVVAGIGNNLFDPNANVTREAVAQMMYNYTQFKKYDTTATADLSKFPDDQNVSSWAETAMSWANAEGLINGSKENGIDYLLPSGATTRAHAASIIMNFDLNVVK